MKREGDRINLEVTEQLVTVHQAKKLFSDLLDAIDKFETEAACNRKVKGTMLFAEKFATDRVPLFTEVRPLFARFFNRYRNYGYHPRDIKTVILDALDSEASLHRQLHFYDKRPEAPN